MGNSISDRPATGPGESGFLDLRACFGDIDVYLFDLLLKGKVKLPLRLLDAGCGTGRNLPYFFRSGCDVHALDEDSDALDHVREMAAELAPHFDPQSAPGRLRVGKIESMAFPAAAFDLVICSAVLHFAQDEEHFQRMLDGLWRVTAPGGLLFMRLASSIGLEGRAERLDSGKYRLPTGGEWFLASEAKLLLATRRLGGEMAEPLRTVNVQNLRCMTTWILRKPRG